MRGAPNDLSSHNVAALGAKRYAHRIGKNVDAMRFIDVIHLFFTLLASARLPSECEAHARRHAFHPNNSPCRDHTKCHAQSDTITSFGSNRKIGLTIPLATGSWLVHSLR
jgi:hypothetical protein